MVLLLAWSGILIWRGLAQPGAEAMPWWEGWLEVLHLGLTYVLIGALLGLVGAAASALVTAVSQRREGG